MIKRQRDSYLRCWMLDASKDDDARCSRFAPNLLCTEFCRSYGHSVIPAGKLCGRGPTDMRRGRSLGRTQAHTTVRRHTYTWYCSHITPHARTRTLLTVSPPQRDFSPYNGHIVHTHPAYGCVRDMNTL